MSLVQNEAPIAFGRVEGVLMKIDLQPCPEFHASGRQQLVQYLELERRLGFRQHVLDERPPEGGGDGKAETIPVPVEQPFSPRPYETPRKGNQFRMVLQHRFHGHIKTEHQPFVFAIMQHLQHVAFPHRSLFIGSFKPSRPCDGLPPPSSSMGRMLSA